MLQIMSCDISSSTGNLRRYEDVSRNFQTHLNYFRTDWVITLGHIRWSFVLKYYLVNLVTPIIYPLMRASNQRPKESALCLWGKTFSAPSFGRYWTPLKPLYCFRTVWVDLSFCNTAYWIFWLTILLFFR